MLRRTFLAAASCALVKGAAAPLDPEDFRHYIEDFNRTFPEEVVNYIPDARAWDWMKANIPFFACPEREIEQLYYYRWWAFRKHIEETPAGLIVTEFLKPVKHAAEYNALSCALGHHIAEGRWLRDARWLDGDIHLLAPCLQNARPVQRMDGLGAIRSLAGRWAPRIPRSGTGRAHGRLCRLGPGAPHAERPLLAARCRRRDGELHQRRPQGEKHSAQHQQLHVRQRDGHCRHRGIGRKKHPGRGVPCQSRAPERPHAKAAVEPARRPSSRRGSNRASSRRSAS